MNKIKISHNKRRNSALLYEFLVKHITKSLVEGKKEEANKAFAISKKYFSKHKPLYEELKIFRDVLDSKVSSPESGRKILDYVYKKNADLNVRELDKQKSQIIKEINYNLGKDVYNHKVSNYVVYASLQTLLNETRNKTKNLNDINKVYLEDVVLEHLLNPVSEQTNLEPVKNGYDNVLYNVILEKFYKKYKDSLNESQKKLLLNYITYLLNGSPSFKMELLKEVSAIKQKLSVITDPKIRADEALMKNLKECYSKFCELDFEKIDDSLILEVLQYIQLENEVYSTNE